MSEPKFSESDSDISSNSSWTILEDNTEPKCEPHPEEEQTEDRVDVSALSSPEIQVEEPLETKSGHALGTPAAMQEDSNINTSDNSFLTFDEYLQERLVEYDFDDDQKEKTEAVTDKEAKQVYRRKCKAETLHILSMTCSLLVLTGLSLLCLLFPHNVNEKVVQSIERSMPLLATPDNCDINQAIEAINRTADMVNTVSDSKLLEKFKGELISDLEKNRPKSEDAFNIQEDEVDLGDTEEYPIDEDAVEDEEYEDNVLESEQENDLKNEDADNCDVPDPRAPSFDTARRSRLSAFKEFLSRTNILTIISCVMHNICVFKLVKHLCKKQEIKEEAKSANNTNGEVRFPEPEEKLLETKIVPKAGTKRKVKLSKINKKIIVRETPVKHPRAFPMKISEHLLRPQVPLNFTAVKSANCFENKLDSMHRINEDYNGSSNEDRYEEMQPKSRELERYKRKTEMFSEQHRRKIKFLKNEFHQQLADAKQKQLESMARSNRISAIKENFILRLKEHREKYLTELKQLKEERQHLLKELCSKKGSSYGVESRDAAVGSYVVPITGLCGFQEKLKMLREKESHNKPVAKKSLPLVSKLQSDSSSKLYPYQSSPCFKIEKLKMEKYTPFHRHLSRNMSNRMSITDAAQDQQERLAEMRQQYLKEQTEILDEYSRLMSDEVAKMENEGDKLVEPCISLLDEIILEAVDTVHRKKEVAPTKNELAVRERTSLVKSKPKFKITHHVEEVDGLCTASTQRERMQDIVAESTRTTKSLLKKLDLYTALFEKQAKNIRLLEAQKLQQEYPEVPKVKHFSKQDPQKCYIERIISKHH